MDTVIVKTAFKIKPRLPGKAIDAAVGAGKSVRNRLIYHWIRRKSKKQLAEFLLKHPKLAKQLLVGGAAAATVGAGTALSGPVIDYLRQRGIGDPEKLREKLKTQVSQGVFGTSTPPAEAVQDEPPPVAEVVEAPPAQPVKAKVEVAPKKRVKTEFQQIPAEDEGESWLL